VHPNRIREWFAKQEQRWRIAYNQRKMDGVNASMTLNRGMD
jgi:hypothetical protein